MPTYNIPKVTIICRYIFNGFGILCLLLVLNFEWASQLMIFMMFTSQYLRNLLKYSILHFCANPQNIKH